ncbi:MAG TPA: histidine kinase dimerization/phospho-acceptor domain-containing protein, partial [Lacipirellulaceae bacterium]|nr:histidine kinase dimerization/phospho-acceptor domain-containing protein [Lacipirellulaceae bacterium]
MLAGAASRASSGPLRARKSVPAESARSEPWTAELSADYLAPLGISSLLDAGIYVDGELVGVVCHEHTGEPREWNLAARAYAGSVADLLALRIKSAEARELRSAMAAGSLRSADRAALQAMEELTAGIAHDLKNLLTTFRIYGKLLSERGDLPDDAREQAREIYRATERGTALARALMEFARPAFERPELVDLGTATADALDLLVETVGPKYELAFTADPGLGQVLIEPGQFRRALVNVTANAAEAMPEGGTIRLRVAQAQARGR